VPSLIMCSFVMIILPEMIYIVQRGRTSTLLYDRV
jgi:hypothetical protein